MGITTRLPIREERNVPRLIRRRNESAETERAAAASFIPTALGNLVWKAICKSSGLRFLLTFCARMRFNKLC